MDEAGAGADRWQSFVLIFDCAGIRSLGEGRAMGREGDGERG